MPIGDYEKRLQDITAETKDADKQLSKLQRELKEKLTPPTHAELAEVDKGGTEKTKAELADALLHRAFELADNKDFDLTQAIEIGKNGRIDWAKGRESGKPQIYFKQITRQEPVKMWEPEYWGRGTGANKGVKLRTREVVTDEVLVVAVLQNGEKPGENTVVTAVAKQKEGKLDFKAGTMLHTGTEAEYKKSTKSENSSATSRLYRGELTQQAYLDEYKKENGVTLQENWKRWDTQVKNTADYWRSEKRKGDVMERLSDRYVALFEQSQEKRKSIKEEAKKVVAEKEKRSQELRANPRIKSIGNQVKYHLTKGNQAEADNYLGMLKDLFPEVPEAELREIIGI